MSGLASVIRHHDVGDASSARTNVRRSLTMVGESRPWLEALNQAARVSPLETITCLEGETGTGKELVARFIHRNSPRREGPFVAINCAALPEQLLESELFGYERGAFTGAHHTKAGQFEQAARGVLFLDEILELAPSAQAKLLRVLQEGELQHLGGTRPIATNVRVIVAANRDLRDAVERGALRADFYYRISAFTIHLPALRDRGADVLLLARHFLEECARVNRRVVTDFTPDAVTALIDHAWPGNARELRNAIERALIVCDGTVIRAMDLALGPPPRRPAAEKTLHAIEQDAIERALREAGGNRSRAARRLGISRTQLYGRLRRYGLEGTDS